MAVGKAAILVVDDDPAIRDLVRQILEQSGYEVVIASGGRAAIQLLDGTHGPFDVLLTDYDMPEVNGLEVASRAQDLGMSVIVMTGSLIETSFPMVAKPFRPATLVAEIRDALAVKS